MSHWVKYENKTFENTNIKILAKAVQNLGYKLDAKCKKIQNSWGDSVVDCALAKQDGTIMSLGFKKNNKNILELVGDFFATGIDEKTFLDCVAQQYQAERIKRMLEENRWTIENITTNNNDEIVINAFEYNY